MENEYTKAVLYWIQNFNDKVKEKAKKEIWMMKLIKLLDESTNGRFKSEQDLRLCIEMRWYCREFISWLVDNDKIDKEFEDNKMLWDIFDSWYRFSDDYIEERLLCYLALSKEPISFLLSIIK